MVIICQPATKIIKVNIICTLHNKWLQFEPVFFFWFFLPNEVVLIIVQIYMHVHIPRPDKTCLKLFHLQFSFDVLLLVLQRKAQEAEFKRKSHEWRKVFFSLPLAKEVADLFINSDWVADHCTAKIRSLNHLGKFWEKQHLVLGIALRGLGGLCWALHVSVRGFWVYELMTIKEAWLCFFLLLSSADCRPTVKCELVWTRNFAIKWVVEENSLQRITVPLTWTWSTVGWRWGLRWSFTTATEIHWKRILITHF